MKKLIKKIRLFFVVAFARRQYKMAKKTADEAKKKLGTNHYVVINPFDDNNLQVIDRKAFRWFKRKYVDAAIRTLVRRNTNGNVFYTVEAKSTMEDVRNGAFYSTAFTDPIDIEARRQAYINWVVELSEKKGDKKG
jgi:hypothetical protein